MNIALWVLQVLLALAFFGHGCATPADERRDREPLWKVLEALVDPADGHTPAAMSASFR